MRHNPYDSKRIPRGYGVHHAYPNGRGSGLGSLFGTLGCGMGVGDPWGDGAGFGYRGYLMGFGDGEYPVDVLEVTSVPPLD